jgi:hypothetical protein
MKSRHNHIRFRSGQQTFAVRHWVYESNIHHATKVRASWCSACNDGLGEARKGKTKSGRWWPFATLDAAKAAAQALHPDRFSTCTFCAEDGSYDRSGDVSY